MKLRHAAALAVLSWWLVLPPMTADRSQVMPNVPLVEWPVFGKYHSATDCEKHKVWLFGQLDRIFYSRSGS
jgi:hypothetical protein